MSFAQAPHSENLRLAREWIIVQGDERDLPIVVDETESREPRMTGPLLQRQRGEIAIIDALVGERRMKPHHRRFILGADGPNQDGRAIRQFARGRILLWIRPDRERRKLVFRYTRPV